MFSRFRHSWHWLLLILAGAANTLAFAPYTLWWLPFFTLALLTWYSRRANSIKQAAGYGFCYGLGWFGIGISWVHISIDQFGGLPLAASLGLMALLVCYLSLFPALASALSRRFQWAACYPLLFASCWLLAEWLRSWLLTGFPWLSLGYSQTSHGLRDIAPLFGETGISFLLAISAASLSQLLTPQKALPRYGYTLFAGVLLVASPQLQTLKGWQYSNDSVSVLLVQGNIRQELRWAPEQEWPTMLKYLDLTRPQLAEADIVIWPEAAVPQLEPLAESFLENLNRSAWYQNTAVITGIIDYNMKTQQAWNNLIVLGQRDQQANQGDYFYHHQNRYSKHHLLPLGEFVPFEQWLRKLAPLFDLPMSSFTRGAYIQPNLVANGFTLLPAICFEIAFPRQIQANFNRDTQLLLTVSNDAWFGDSIGPHQHLQLAQMRALEFGRPVLRATNNGITATIDSAGQIQQRVPQFSEAVLQDQIQLSTGETLYSRIGDWPLYSLCLLLLISGTIRTYRLSAAI